jgi:amidase
VPAELAELQSAHANIQSLEAGWYLRDMISPDPDQVSDLLKNTIAEAHAMSADEIESCRAVLAETRVFAVRVFDDFDIVITLAAPGEAPRSLSSTGDPAFNRFASTAGLPSAGMPVGNGPGGLPLGLQIIGPPDSDQALLEIVCRLTFDEAISDIPELPVIV